MARMLGELVEFGVIEDRAGKSHIKGLESNATERTRGEEGRRKWGLGSGLGCSLNRMTAGLNRMQSNFPDSAHNVSHALSNLDLSFSFCQPLFSKTGIAKNDKTLRLRAVNLQEITEMCLTLDPHNQEFLKCFNRFIIILLLLKVFWDNFYGRCYIKINWFEMAEALKDYNRLIKWVTSLHVWHDAQRKKVKK